MSGRLNAVLSMTVPEKTAAAFAIATLAATGSSSTQTVLQDAEKAKRNRSVKARTIRLDLSAVTIPVEKRGSRKLQAVPAPADPHFLGCHFKAIPHSQGGLVNTMAIWGVRLPETS